MNLHQLPPAVHADGNPMDAYEPVRAAFTLEARNGEMINVVDGLFAISDALQAVAQALVRLGHNDAATSMGAMEALGAAVLDGADRIATAVSRAR
jgi:hypothetical protein